MQIIHVAPLSRGFAKECLSYFTALQIRPGALVRVPLRGKIVSALVIETQSVLDAKTELKSLPFALKKTENISNEGFLSEEFIESARVASYEQATTFGAFLHSLIPKTLREKPLTVKNTEELSQKTNSDSSKKEKELFVGDIEARMLHYRSIIREEFARKYSVFIISAEIAGLRRLAPFVSKGIEQFSFSVHNSLKKSELEKVWVKALNEEHPVLIVATPFFLCLPIKNIGAIILENESSPAYIGRGRPYANLRKFTEIFAEKIGARLIIGDSLPRTELWQKGLGQELLLLLERPTKASGFPKVEIVDMKQYRPPAERKFRILSNELLELIRTGREKNERFLVIVGRRGKATITLCSDCGQTVLCPSCGLPMVLHSVNPINKKHPGGEFFFLCHRCATEASANARCKYCGGWRLMPLGAGSEKIAEDLAVIFPSTRIFRADKDKTPSVSSLTKTIADFEVSAGSILVATEMALPYLSERVSNSALISTDSYWGVPDFRMNERVMRILLEIKEKTERQFLIQTRMPNAIPFRFAVSGDLRGFFREELLTRKEFAYPPFTMLIKIGREGNNTAVTRDMKELQERLGGDYPLTIFEARKSEKGFVSSNALIRITKEKWIDKDLIEKLLSLPPVFRVEVEPESLL